MANSCSSCRFFRPYRPLSQLLMRDLGNDEEQLMSTLLRMMEDERQHQDAEAEHRRELVRQRQQRSWPARPKMSDYCGKEEQQGRFLVAELKNAGGQCRDHQPGPADPRPCASCRHRATGGGGERDAEQLATLAQLSANATGLGQGGGTGKLDEYRSFIATSKCLEAAQVYYAGKLTHRVPAYVAFCLKHSSDRDFVPCAVHNPHDTCADWTASDAPPAMSLQDAMKLL